MKGQNRRFCPTCCREVATVIWREKVEVPVANEKVSVEFDAHRCPICGELLCERGFDEVMVELIEKAMKSK